MLSTGKKERDLTVTAREPGALLHPIPAFSSLQPTCQVSLESNSGECGAGSARVGARWYHNHVKARGGAAEDTSSGAWVVLSVLEQGKHCPASMRVHQDPRRIKHLPFHPSLSPHQPVCPHHHHHHSPAPWKVSHACQLSHRSSKSRTSGYMPVNDVRSKCLDGLFNFHPEPYLQCWTVCGPTQTSPPNTKQLISSYTLYPFPASISIIFKTKQNKNGYP